MFQTILIANRGEIAVRLIRACHEMGIRAVAVYSEADASALHTRLADEAIFIGPPAPSESYLREDRIIEAALTAGAQAIHPGYGFLSESPDFAEAVQAAGLIFIGPPAKVIRAMGVKTEARTLMQSAGVPIVPGFQDDSADDPAYLQAADQIGYPVIIKAAGGGGGKGMRIVRSSIELIDAMAAARRESQHAFSDDRIFLEKYIEHGRHIEIQIIADTHGNTVHLFERECSIQRRHQKIIEESPSPLLTPEIRTQMGAAAVAAAQAVGYVNAGTVEFIADQGGDFYFLEMNTRLQVEHPVTELVTGVDLAKLQIRIAAGEPLPFTQAELTQRGHAIECRVYAEDAPAGFLPAVGPILLASEPQGPGIRVDAGVVTGDEVTLHYDPMIAKLIVYAESRTDAIQRMKSALGEYVILGVTTNIEFLQAVIDHPAFAAGELSTDFITDHLTPWQVTDEQVPDTALIVAALGELQSMPQQHSQAASDDADQFSPWNRTDSFRMGRS